MSERKRTKQRQKRARNEKQRKARRTQKEKAKAIASEAVDRIGTAVFLEYFVPHYVEPSIVAAFGVLGASFLVFVVRCWREMKRKG